MSVSLSTSMLAISTRGRLHGLGAAGLTTALLGSFGRLNIAMVLAVTTPVTKTSAYRETITLASAYRETAEKKSVFRETITL